MIIGFDIETTLFDYGVEPSLRLWTLWNPDYKVYGFSYSSFYERMAELWKSLDNMSEDIIIVAHNLEFDFTIMIQENIFDDETLDKSRTIMSVLEKPSFAIFRKKKLSDTHSSRRLIFVDLLNYVSGKLSQVAEAYGVPGKHDIDLATENTQELLSYCFQDSKICYQVLNILDPFVARNIQKKFRLTISSMAYADLQYTTGWKTFNRAWFIKKLERESYYGGRVQFNRFLMKDINFSDNWTKGVKYDINSSYPFSMWDMKVPVKLIGKISVATGGYTDSDVVNLLKEIFESDDMTAIVKARVILRKDCLPYRKNSKLMFDSDNNELVGVWHIEEFYPAVRDFEATLIYVGSITLYKCIKGMFNPWVKKWMKIKNDKTKNNNVRRNYAKLMLNSATGKFGEKSRKTTDPYQVLDTRSLRDLERTEYTIRHIIGKDERTVYEVKVNAGVITIQETMEFEAKGACTVIVAGITARSRRYLWESIRYKQWLYVDTDSVLLLYPDNIDNNLISDRQLGKWKLEGCEYQRTTFTSKKNAKSDSGEISGYCEYRVKGRKDYQCRHEIKLKGVGAIDIKGTRVVNEHSYDMGVFEYTSVVRPKESFRRGLPKFSLIDKVKRRLVGGLKP